MSPPTITYMISSPTASSPSFIHAFAKNMPGSSSVCATAWRTFSSSAEKRMPFTGFASVSPSRTRALASSRTTPLCTRNMPVRARLPEPLASLSQASMEGVSRRCDDAGVAQSAEPADISISRPCSSAGRMAVRFSRAARSLPGRLTIRVRFRIPATPRDRQPLGVTLMLSARMVSARPGVWRSITSSVASGVMSRGEKPVPPVVSTSATPASASCFSASAIFPRSSGSMAAWTTS